MIEHAQRFLSTRHSLRRDDPPTCGWEYRRLLQRASGVALLLTLVVSVTALAQGRYLREPVELCPVNGILDVTLQVWLVDGYPVEVIDKNSQQIAIKEMDLRAYHLAEGGTWQFCDGRQRPIDNPMIPGPTFRLKKGTPGKTDGDKFRLQLINKLPPVDASHHHACDDVRDFSVTTIAPKKDTQGNWTCNLGDFPLLSEPVMTWPACFHGDNVTNLHFHGFHISPQAPQDFVLLSLYPEGSSNVKPTDTDVVGAYQFVLDPLLYTQAEGTHWYHPHQHGSTALQVTNGMAGFLLVEGPFDAALNGLYKKDGGLEDKVLVLQQIGEQNNLLQPTITLVNKSDNKPCTQQNPDKDCYCQGGGPGPPPISVNGTINPTIIMRPGEVQRWRLLNAAVQAGAQQQIGFHNEFQVKQIAQDGVQFAPENYDKQPLLVQVTPGQGQPPSGTLVNVAAGDRLDLLIKAPRVIEPTCYSQVHQVLTDQLHVSARDQINAEQRAKIKAAEVSGNNPPLLTVCVDPLLKPKPMELPTSQQWPPLPDFLQNIGDREIKRGRTVAFSIAGKGAGNPAANFLIDGVQYCPDCVNQTLTLDTAEEWIITNDSAVQHPFHIHTNPHQLLEQGTIIPNKTSGTFQAALTYAPPMWEDTVALPGVPVKGQEGFGVKGCVDFRGDPLQPVEQACTAACKKWNATFANEWSQPENRAWWNCRCCEVSAMGYVKIRLKPTEFTGPMVLHCHILGHEDRGMMQNVQVVCPPGLDQSGKGFYGKPKPGQQECVEGNFTPAAPACPSSYTTGPACFEKRS